MHVRQQIREQFVNALTATGIHTENGRIFSVYDSILPMFSVYSREESIEVDNNRGRLQGLQLRTLKVSVEIYVKAETGLDDNFDSLSAIAETAIFNFPWLNDRNLIPCLDLEGIETEVDQGGENALGVMTLTFSVRYRTEDGNPEVFL